MSRRTASSLAASSLARFHIVSTKGIKGPLAGRGGAPATTAAQPILSSSFTSCSINHDEHRYNGAINTSRSFSTTSASLSSTSSSSSSSEYKSPLADYFNMIQNNETATGSPSPNMETVPEIPRLKCGVAEHDIKFKTSSYSRLMLPPYVHTNEYKVILEVNMNLLPLETPLEEKIFHQIVGTRYIAEKKKLKLTCNLFASRIENKRHLCSMLDRIIFGAKRLAAEIHNSESKVEG